MPKPPAIAPLIETLRIDDLGAAGDGIANLADGGKIFIPLAAPGDQLRVAVSRKTPERAHGEILGIIAPGATRTTPPCPYFGNCGGCKLQHISGDFYDSWKTDLLRAALSRAGYTAPLIAPLLTIGFGHRRRADLAATRYNGAVQLGLHRAGSNDIIDLAACLLLTAPLNAMLPGLRRLLATLTAFKRSASIVLNQLDSGVDLLLKLDAEPSADDRQRLIAFAKSAGLTRISIIVREQSPESIIILKPSTVSFGGILIDIPPGAFLQATKDGEAAILAAIIAGLPGKLTAKSKFIELYAGLGTFSFPLAQHARLTAYEGSPTAAGAAAHAIRRQALNRLTMTTRDLARRPLIKADFAGAACVILDPPFDGAAAQIPALAASGVARIIYVSCNQAALARDLKPLHAAGYRLVNATPIDQFPASPHLESVIVLER